MGLTQLLRGEIDRATFARRYGHRGPHEFEVSSARPAEDLDWIEQQLIGLQVAPLDVPALLARQEGVETAAWERFRQRYPRKIAKIRRRIAQVGAAFRDREGARSEVIRCFWVLRAFVLRAGELSGHGDDLFFLTIDEILAVLAGDQTPLSHAAIVARELGIPAVVGCGNATMRLHTGDLVRVNGGEGTVEVLVVADAA